jgi:death-on-curing protein
VIRSFPTVEEVVAIHDDLIAQFGGSMGLRDMGALESALLRPQMGYYDGIIEEAAALMESLAMNHPFVDGNKRVAFAATEVFLGMNGWYIDCDSEEAYAHFMRLFETNSFRFAELKDWLEGNVRPLPGAASNQ